jgi:hypothetical protein
MRISKWLGFILLIVMMNASFAMKGVVVGGKNTGPDALVNTANHAVTADALTDMNISQFNNDSGFVTAGEFVRVTANQALTSDIASTANYAIQAATADALTSMAISQFTNDSQYVTAGEKIAAAVTADYAIQAATADALTSMAVSQFTNDSQYVTAGEQIASAITADYAVSASTANVAITANYATTAGSAQSGATGIVFNNGTDTQVFADPTCLSTSMVVIKITSGVPQGVWEVDSGSPTDGNFTITSTYNGVAVNETAPITFTYYVVR